MKLPEEEATITKNKKLTWGLLCAFQDFKILCFFPSNFSMCCSSSEYNDILDKRNHSQHYEKNSF